MLTSKKKKGDTVKVIDPPKKIIVIILNAISFNTIAYMFSTIKSIYLHTSIWKEDWQRCDCLLKTMQSRCEEQCRNKSIKNIYPIRRVQRFNDRKYIGISRHETESNNIEVKKRHATNMAKKRRIRNL